MISQLLGRMGPLLSRLVPTHLAAKGLSKISPKLGDFIQAASIAGYTTDEALDFLRDRYEPIGRKTEKGRLQKGAVQGTLRPDEMGSHQKLESFKGGIAAPLAAAAGAGYLATRGGGEQQQQAVSPDQIDYPQQTQQQGQIGYNRPEIEYNPYDKRPNVPQENQAIATQPPPEEKYPPAQQQNNFSTDFLKYLRPLITNKTIDKEDSETINNFWKYWMATDGQKRSSPFVEFEKFRSGTSDWLKQGQQQQSENQGRPQQQQQLAQAMQALAQILKQ